MVTCLYKGKGCTSQNFFKVYVRVNFVFFCVGLALSQSSSLREWSLFLLFFGFDASIISGRAIKKQQKEGSTVASVSHCPD
jgi:hypothetical protein